LEALERELSRLRQFHHRVLKETKNFKKDSKLRQVNGKQIFISQYVERDLSMYGYEGVMLTLFVQAKSEGGEFERKV